jgi:hypothetical protein
VQGDQVPRLWQLAEAQVGEPLEQCAQGDRALHTSQRGAEAGMHARTECEMVACIRPGDVESTRIGERERVPIGAAQQKQHHFPRADPLSTDLNVGVRGAQRHLHGALESEDLLDSCRPEVWVFAQLRELAGILKQ